MLAESVRRFATEQIAPKVREMDENEAMDMTIVEQMFEQGLMAFEIPEEYGGSGMNFTSAIVGIEELAKVDSVGICSMRRTQYSRGHCDIEIWHRGIEEEMATQVGY